MERNFAKEVVELKDKDDLKEIQRQWRKDIIKDVEKVLAPGLLSAESDLTVVALFKLMQRFYIEQEGEGADVILSMWSLLRKKAEDLCVDDLH